MITEELVNIATGLRKLITSADSSVDVSGVDESATASSTTSFGTRRLFGENDEKEEEEEQGGGASAASSADALDWRPLFDSVESIKTKDSTSSADALDWRPLFDSVDCIDTKDSDSLRSLLHLDRLFKEEKDATTSFSNMGVRKLFEEDEKAAAASLS